MKLHGNAKLTQVQRRLLVTRVLEEHWKFTDAADAFGVRNGPRIDRFGVGVTVITISRIDQRRRSGCVEHRRRSWR